MDLLSDILAHMRLRGTLYFRTSFTSPWGVKVPAFEDVSRFHYAHAGRCFVRIDGVRKPVRLEQGDLVIIMRGAAHTLYCDPTTEEDALTLDRVIEESGFSGSGTLVFGELDTHHETQLVCGHFSFETNASHPLLDALPAYIHVANYGERSGTWMEHTLKVIGAEAGRDRLGSDLIALKLSEIIYAQALRDYLDSAGAEEPVLAGFADRRIAGALNAIHDAPGKPWSLETLARHVGMSRTSFASKFSQALSMTPHAYLTYWRMQIARRALEETDEPNIEIAEMVGYQSEAAFGRVFKKTFGDAPATYRRQSRDMVAAL